MNTSSAVTATVSGTINPPHYQDMLRGRKGVVTRRARDGDFVRYKRGLTYRTTGGGIGIYVGTTKTGSEWFVYDVEDYVQMCKRFEFFA